MKILTNAVTYIRAHPRSVGLNCILLAAAIGQTSVFWATGWLDHVLHAGFGLLAAPGVLLFLSGPKVFEGLRKGPPRG